MQRRIIRVLAFEGCPHAEMARSAARRAIERSEMDIELREIELGTPETPEEFSRYPSPTVLVGRLDVMGEADLTGGIGCRASGAPTVVQIQEAMDSAWVGAT